ncbi:MAG: hypothetical protein IKH86_03165 [Prevotella sp.]|nr:hypothetical protein [Prevotella sp.]
MNNFSLFSLQVSGFCRNLQPCINFLWLLNNEEKRMLRERAAIGAMQGMLSGWNIVDDDDPPASRLAKIARECADALVKELEKQPK